MTVRFPVALTAEAALSAPLGRAGREREAELLLGDKAQFVRQLSGPAFDTREEALAAYDGRVDGEGHKAVLPEDRFCELVEVTVQPKGRVVKSGQAQPVYSGGRRWPKPPQPLQTVWRLSVGYWRPLTAQAAAATHPDQARQARKSAGAERLSPEALRRLAQTPMKPVKPQQPLDIGLFEAPLPESPGHFIPDE